MAGVAIHISVHNNTQRNQQYSIFKFFFMDTLYTASMVVEKQVNNVSVKSNSLIFTADLRNYFLVSFVHDVCNYNRKVSFLISLQAKL